MLKYETAKALKEAGFPQNGLNICTYSNCGCHDKKKCGGCDNCMRIRIPNLSELIEACGDKIILWQYEKKWYSVKYDENDYVAENCLDRTWYDSIEGLSPEESMAKLYIELNKV